MSGISARGGRNSSDGAIPTLRGRVEPPAVHSRYTPPCSGALAFTPNATSTRAILSWRCCARNSDRRRCRLIKKYVKVKMDTITSSKSTNGRLVRCESTRSAHVEGGLGGAPPAAPLDIREAVMRGIYEVVKSAS
ncbi:uncharacterized protein Tco025E_01631 [Trypanosoma conorhini]|uniref:Uncharacterized protein n=1 Tax=Trypanosoma conorhini TaxID=83891 RepID=A0A422Q804_9TRYP|nr:uncharacterized protein Tco025E_01631 [Trypanosoma conorhini]RNF26102.1 hypothetical protein Tco025E_01631 [Trypanosoma conorhini]